ncbi:receptor-like protein Cf-9 homolog [Manihot esculenta]|uniref:Leucine-rich repeat-containing N-terminal plant-type domain-containing protein n=1 Tax=Manihot esculenta TaxID=3983 RepID=A0A2C9V2S8_MANES|nr:receptor-like protein Cf-9 homolog [Manihot esculenta]
MGCSLWLSQLLCLLFFLLHFQAASSPFSSSNLSSSHVLCHLHQSHALLHFKNSFSITSSASMDSRLHDVPYPKTETWEEGSDCCLWDGVTCDLQTGYVIGLRLSRSMLFGSFHPNNSLFLLSHLQFLDLSNNDFNSSSISPQFGGFFNLRHLNLNNSGFAGQVPSKITYLSNLVSLDISFNDLTLEATTFNRLAKNLTKLRELILDEVNMSMVEPIWLMNLSSSFSSLYLNDCGLQGEFPRNLLQRQKLRVLDLWGNHDLIVCLPRSNWSSSLDVLFVSYTKITIHLDGDLINNLRSVKMLGLSGCSFVGSNVSWFGNLRQLSRLYLSSNNFSGHIPSAFGNLEHLTHLALSSNNFDGQIPPWLLNHNQLIGLFLSNNKLIGTIPNSFANLATLQHLDLSSNRLVGPIPSQVRRLSSLIVLDLSNNLLNATIPSSLLNLPHLQFLFLNSNLFMGRIRRFQHNSLIHIDLSNNKLEGAIPISICKLKQLQVLHFSNNSFSGSIPHCLGNFSNNLLALHLGMNSFQGSIPTFSKDNSLRYLNLHGNQLGGRIPRSILNCKSLEVLDIGNNEIDDTFPVFLETLPQLQVLVLRSNKLHGFLKAASANYSFSKLRIFDMSNNNLSGPLPLEYFYSFEAMIVSDESFRYMGITGFYRYTYSVDVTWKGSGIELRIQTMFTTIDLSANKFTGNIPWSIGKLVSLKQLNLSHNYLTGNIPPDLGKLINLESLDLSSNTLTGKIPTDLVDLIFLSVFRVSHNQLAGRIPLGKQLDTFDSSSYEGNSGLCGFPLKKACEDGERQPTTLSEEGDSESENGFGWKAVLIGYVCGFIFSVTMAHLMFRTRKPIWVVKMVEAKTKTYRCRGKN